MKGITTLASILILLGLTHLQAKESQTTCSRQVSFSSHESLIHAFHAAAAEAPAVTLNDFLLSGVCVNEPGRNNKTALHYAAAKTNQPTIEWLIERGAELEAVDADGCTPLLYAAKGDRLWRVNDLLKAGASIAQQDNEGNSLLHYAVKGGNLQIVKELLRLGSSPNALTSKIGMTPLHLAAKQGSVKIAEALLFAGAEINATEINGWTPLHHAAFNSKNPEMITLLLEWNADAALKDEFKRTARDLAEIRSSGDSLDCVLCPLALIKSQRWDEVILRLRTAELLPSPAKEALEIRLGLKQELQQ